MTRINVIPVEELHPKHLLAEYRELPRIFKASEKWHDRGGVPGDLPDTYRLGKGHVLFFYDKLNYCFFRQEALYFECLRRGYNVKFRPSQWELYKNWAPTELCKQYHPTTEALQLNRERINERLATMKAK